MKTPKGGGLWSFRVSEYTHVPVGGAPQLQRQRLLGLGPYQTYPTYLLIWLLIGIFYNKLQPLISITLGSVKSF